MIERILINRVKAIQMQNFQEILDFWFLPKADEGYLQPRKEWFVKDPAFDEEIVKRFSKIYEQAKNGELADWQDSLEGCLATILLFDQFTRNMFRDSGRAFEADALARDLARKMIADPEFKALANVQKTFAVLPFEHSENLEDQKLAVKLFKTFGTEVEIDYAIKHQVIIERFGRFPHRNKALERPSTEEELEFLKQPGSGF